VSPVLTAALCYAALNGIGYAFGTPAALGVAFGIAFMSGIYLIVGGAS
jgi:hypothetical protein